MGASDTVTASRSNGAIGLLLLVAVLVCPLLLGVDPLAGRLEYDEAFNLQIAESLRHGDGYSTFGALGSGEPWLFDPHITTGPVVLLPVAGVWFLADGSLTAVRALLLAFLLAYAAGWWLLLRQVRDGWFAASFAVAAALAATAASAGRILGELPGAALLVWAAVAISRRRPALAALAIGLAVQTKIVYGLAGALMLAVWLFVATTVGERPRLRLLLSMAALAAAPTLMFESYRLVSVGSVESYLQSIGQFQQFLEGQKAPQWLDATMLGAKVSALLGTLPAHAWLALSGGAVALLCRSAFLEGRRSRLADEATSIPQATATALTGLVVAGVAMLVGWITQSLQTGVRQALPFFLLAVPALVALCLLLSVRYLRESSSALRPWRFPQASVAAAALLLASSLVIALIQSLQATATDERALASAQEQREVAKAIRSLRPASLYAKGFWHNPEYQLLTGVRGVTRRTYDRQLLIVQDYQVALSNTTWADHESKCGDVVRRTEFTLLCWMPAAPTKELFRVLDWGPKSSPAGTVPLAQPGGGSALWFRIAPVVPEDVGPIRLHVGRHVTEAVLSRPNADLLSGVAPASLFMEPGSHDVVLEQVVTERRMLVGTLRVEPK
jgi:hypothetical protein